MIAVLVCLLAAGALAAPPAKIVVDYPEEGSVFPPEITIGRMGDS